MSCQILRDIAPDSNQTAFDRKIPRQNAISGRTHFVKGTDDGGVSFTWPRPGQNNPLVFTDPTGLERVRQNDLGLVPFVRDEACYYLALVGIAQSYAGKELSLAQVNGLTKSLTDLKVLGDKYSVENGPKVIESALSLMGV